MQSVVMLKSGSSNLLVNKIELVVVLRSKIHCIVLAFSSVLNEVFPKSKVCVKTVFEFSNNLWSVLSTVLKRVRLSLTNWRTVEEEMLCRFYTMATVK